MTKVIARYTRLATGEWGLRSPVPVEEGQEVLVEKRSGSQKVEHVGTVVWFGGGSWLATLAPKAESRRRRPSRGASQEAQAKLDEVDSWPEEDFLLFYDEPLSNDEVYCDIY